MNDVNKRYEAELPREPQFRPDLPQQAQGLSAPPAHRQAPDLGALVARWKDELAAARVTIANLSHELAVKVAVDADARVKEAERRMTVYMDAGLDAREKQDAARAERDGAYSERNQLVAAFSKLFPASLERHVGDPWEDDWRWIVFIDLPTGQATWHIHDTELPRFDHLPRLAGRTWDGHTTEQKYDRLAALQVRKP